MYFSTDNMFKSTRISERFTWDRLLKLHQYFHVDDTSRDPPLRQPGHDKLPQTQHVMTVVNDHCKNAFHPHREVSIDEAIIIFTGRFGFKQYDLMKPTKLHGEVICERYVVMRMLCIITMLTIHIVQQ